RGPGAQRARARTLPPGGQAGAVLAGRLLRASAPSALGPGPGGLLLTELLLPWTTARPLVYPPSRAAGSFCLRRTVGHPHPVAGGGCRTSAAGPPSRSSPRVARDGWATIGADRGMPGRGLPRRGRPTGTSRRVR